MKYRYVVLDFETTGLYPAEDEILQVAIIDNHKRILINEICCPKKKTEWHKAEIINGINKEMVLNKKTFNFYIKKIKEIFSETECIICYNIGFEKKFLKKYGFDIYEYKFIDVMILFSRVYNKRNCYGRFCWQKLTTCADYYHFDYSPHDALQDVLATQYCYEKIINKNA